jgi:hypothetical protein
MIQSNNLIDNNLYTIDIISGERNDLLTKEELKSMGYAHSSYFSVIDYDDNNIFVMIRHPLTENPVPNYVYDILKISLSDGSIEPLVNITEGEDPDNDFGLKVLNFTKEGLLYLNYADSSYSLCYMPYDNMSSQIVLASPDYGLESSVDILEQYGITFKTLHNAYFYTDDNYDVMTFYSDLVVPQLPATSDDFISFNETILDNLDVTDMAKSSVKEAGEIALSQDAYDEYSPMDIYPYNYTYRYAGLPPGPIKIASVQGIDAVLNRADHNYLYMCAKEDFSGTHNFAVTYQEHMKNAARYAKALNERGIK